MRNIRLYKREVQMWLTARTSFLWISILLIHSFPSLPHINMSSPSLPIVTQLIFHITHLFVCSLRRHPKSYWNIVNRSNWQRLSYNNIIIANNMSLYDDIQLEIIRIELCLNSPESNTSKEILPCCDHFRCMMARQVEINEEASSFTTTHLAFPQCHM